MKTKYTFWELINDYKIEIPKIQRDYAQGRKDTDICKIVDIFLNDIIFSIKNDKELNLDFVYGKIENNLLTPLDGQQRLTTLFLIHWYLATKEERITLEVKEVLSKFRYETRISSHDFCQNLILEGINYKEVKEKISDIIQDSKWYFLSWGLDPTVSSMLNMLDLIHAKLYPIKEHLFDKLLNGRNISFFFLPLERFKLEDELYIKMNARGLELTKFEKFKAKFSEYLKSISEKSKLDNEWLDIFWSLEKNKEIKITTENVDKRFFNFFQNITLNFYAEKNNINKELKSYKLFDIYESVYAEERYVTLVIKILDSLIDYQDINDVFSKFLSSSADYNDRLNFHSLCLFFNTFGQINDTNKIFLSPWLRVTRNLINNTLTQSPENFENGLRSITELSENISTIYDYIASFGDTVKYFSKTQRDEESLKARLIIENPKWERSFMEVERHSYFDGQIGFILKFSKSEGNKYNKDLFEEYSSKLAVLFSDKFKEKYNFLFQRALLAKGDYLPQVGYGENYTFCVFDEALRKKQENWRKVFKLETSSLILKDLLNDLRKDNIQYDLQKIIDQYTVENWRALIIDNYENISYCQYRQIRKHSTRKIFLLSKSQMNGRHKELESWNLFKKKYEDIIYNPFSEPVWYWESTSSASPCIVLGVFSYNDHKYAIDIIHEVNKSYKFKFFERSENPVSMKIENLLLELGFIKNNILFELKVPETNIENKIIEICSSLKTIKQK